MAGSGNGPFRLTLERGTDSHYLAWVDEVPGCAIRAESRQAAIDRAPALIRSFLTWAGVADVPEQVAVEVGEEGSSEISAEEDTEVLVGVDRRALTPEDWQAIERLLDRSRAELLELIDALPEEALTSTREGSERTIRDEIQHIAFVEFMYAMWTFDLQTKQGIRDFLAWTRDLARERMRRLANDSAADLTWADWGGAPRLEPWTARKSARRLIWHELLHVRAIQDSLRQR